MQKSHEKMMRQALALAKRGLGRTSPNPAVGCVIVRNGEIVGRGYHKKAGTPHAEVHALNDAGPLAEGADVYVTLEPCSHYGKTPPCAKALVDAKVARVFVAVVDPNPLVSGKGIAILREAGISVETGILEEECREVNEGFFKWIATGLPFVVLKSALTLDGKSATASGDSKWVTSAAARRQVHRLRGQLDGIMVGVGTALKDDPLLTCRAPGGRDPIRIVVDSALRLPLHAALFNPHSIAPAIVATCSRDAARLEAFSSHGAEIIVCREADGRVDLVDLWGKLGKRGIQSILLEGGAGLAGAALRLGLIDKFQIYLAPKLVGGEGMGLFSGAGAALMADAYPLERVTVRRVGVDFLVQGYPAKGRICT